MKERSIPYAKELRSVNLIKSSSMAILWRQLDYWFEKNPDGFYKFLEPCPTNKKYKNGDSWAEELMFSTDEFRTAFDGIGIRYTSKSEYAASENKFGGKLFCSYFDKIQGLTHYFRNHELAEKVLSDIGKGNPGRFVFQSTGIGKGNLRRLGKAIYVDWDCPDTGIGKGNPDTSYPDTTQYTTQEITQDTTSISENEFSQELPVVEKIKPEDVFKIKEPEDIFEGIPGYEPVKDKKNQKEKSSAQKEKGDPFYIPTLESFGMYYTIWSKAKTGNSDGDKFVWNPKENKQLQFLISALKKACVDQGNSAAIQSPEIFVDQVLRPYFETYIKISLEQEFYLQQFTPTFMYSKFNEIIIKIKSYVTTGKINGRTVESVKQSITEQQREADRKFIAEQRW